MSLNNFVDISPEFEKYKQYSESFKRLRKLWGVSEEFFNLELSKTKCIIGSGKSGMKMWISKNKYFFIKELTLTDKKSLKNLMISYMKYMSKNKHSLLPKFYGIYEKKSIVYIIQRNLNPYNNDTWIYDLKGSHRKRIVKNFNIKKIGMDNNFGESKIYIKNANKIKKQLKKDTAFLSDNNLVDYSLLLCMRDKKEHNEKLDEDWKRWGKGKFCCDIEGPGPSIKIPINLNIGIIDILQKYNTAKFIESFFKSKENIMDRSKSEVTIINNISYKKRFDNLIHKLLKPKITKTIKHSKTKKKYTRKKS